MVAVLVARATTSHTMSIVKPDGGRVSMYSTPPQFKYSNVARFGQIEREGYKTATRKVGDGLATLSFTSSIYSLDHTQSIEHVAAAIRKLGADGTRVRFNNGSVEFQQAIWWFIKGLDFEVTQLSRSNQASRISVEWQLEEAVDVEISISKVVPPPPPPPAARPIGGNVREHRVVPGDTLWGIAARYLGNGARWPEIYNMNRGVVGGNPNLIFPGQVFKVPA
ncbi:LysM-like peptidoglycan-binding protein [Arthrobacter phage StevieBAY]|uniref:LysM-like peptidoglycan-binding protein n=1 Tax=Arthrobacter phage StevieBAY TaxID=2725609 RepID=A0A6M3T785_9CAUD|nr:LysM-like peptidoglycan-binding protein [Arthrobacter phage StevieBAY]